jgi:hypothetical protein
VSYVLILGWATYALATSGIDADRAATKAAAAAVTVSAVLQALALLSWLAGVDPNIGRELHELLENRLVAASRAGALTGDLSAVTLHVWEVPLLYRRLFPYAFRQALRRLFAASVQEWAYCPRLLRVGEGGLRHLAPSGVVFRKNRGLVGISLQASDRENIHRVDFEQPEFLQALIDGEALWRERNGDKITRRLRFSDAKKLAERYSEALAVVVQHPKSGEAIGCLTIESEKGHALGVNESPQLKTALQDLAGNIGRILARKG